MTKAKSSKKDKSKPKRKRTHKSHRVVHLGKEIEKRRVVSEKVESIRKAAAVDTSEFPLPDDPIFGAAETPDIASAVPSYRDLPPPPRIGQAVITMSKRSYTPPVWQESPGGGGSLDYFLFPGVMGYAVLKKDGTIWVCTPEPEEEHHRTDWTVVEAFLNALHPRCRVVNCVWGELLDMLVKLGWINRPEMVVDIQHAHPREIDVWYPPPEGVVRRGYVDGGLGEVSDTPFVKD